MKHIVCTLFEGHYHYGVASLANSLIYNGFEGEIYAGYKGKLPNWSQNGVKGTVLSWKNSTTLNLENGAKIHFVPVDVEYQLTNYKPSFVIELMSKLIGTNTGIFYFDPDIVIKCKWSFFESWLSYGVPLVHEITNNDMPPTHPVKMAWRNLIHKYGNEVKNEIHSYINAGFWGIKESDLDFAVQYKKFIDVSISEFKMDLKDFSFDLDRTNIFFAKDQDALNIAAMCCNVPVSEYGPEAMDFIHGGKVMSHAIGNPKPWVKNYYKSFFKGAPPTLADKQYWQNARGPIKLYSDFYLSMKDLELKLTSFLGRFYRKY